MLRMQGKIGWNGFAGEKQGLRKEHGSLLRI
jgi:hypothetical protein